MELSSFIWSDAFWLPENVTWQQIEKEGNYPSPYDLLYCFPLALVIVIIRLIVERILFVPFGMICGLHRKKVEHNDVLENAFKKGSITENYIKNLSLAINWPETKIQAWFYRRQKMSRISTKFNESGWRATFYAIMFMYGLTCLWDKPWFKDVSQSWTNRSTFIVPDDIRWYYLVELAFYGSLMISQFVDVKRKDFWQMLVHHVITIILISASWLCNCVRIGSLIILCHDAGDIPMEIAKLFGYLKMKQCTDVTFVVFMIVWIVSRLIIYPFVLLKSVLNDASQLVGPVSLFIFTMLLTLLMFLHIMWSWMIIQILRSFISGTQKDVRSDSEENLSEIDEKKAS